MQITNGIISIYYRSAQCRHCLNARCTIQCYHFIILYSILVYTISLFFIKFNWWVKSHKNVEKSNLFILESKTLVGLLAPRLHNPQGKDGTTLNCCEKFSVVLQDSSSYVLLSKLVSAHVQKERRSTEIESSTIFIARTWTNACYFKTTSKITKANELL